MQQKNNKLNKCFLKQYFYSQNPFICLQTFNFHQCVTVQLQNNKFPFKYICSYFLEWPTEEALLKLVRIRKAPTSLKTNDWKPFYTWNYFSAFPHRIAISHVHFEVMLFMPLQMLYILQVININPYQCFEQGRNRWGYSIWKVELLAGFPRSWFRYGGVTF